MKLFSLATTMLTTFIFLAAQAKVDVARSKVTNHKITVVNNSKVTAKVTCSNRMTSNANGQDGLALVVLDGGSEQFDKPCPFVTARNGLSAFYLRIYLQGNQAPRERAIRIDTYTYCIPSGFSIAGAIATPGFRQITIESYDKHGTDKYATFKISCD